MISKCMICMRGEDRLYDSICLALEMNLWASKMVGWIMIEQDSSIDMEEEKKTSLKKKTKPLRFAQYLQNATTPCVSKENKKDDTL